MIINYENIDSKHRRTIESIESKPHVKYIRYLLSKKYSPILIKKELQRLGLSAPHEKPLTVYYLTVIDPVIKASGLSYLYADYKNRLIRANSKRGDYSKNILNYRLHLGEDLDGQSNFCKLIKYLEIDSMWCQEIYRFHGSAVNMPTDELGNRILTTSVSTRGSGSVEKILLLEKRYVIDKLLLENVTIDRISKYCRENLKIAVYDADIKLYKTMFFNVQTQTIEDKIKSLTAERNSLEILIKDAEERLGEYADFTLGERIALIEQTKKRVDELTDSIKDLNMLYTNAATKIAAINEDNFEDMFADVVTRAYRRFSSLDNYKDRDVVDPLFKTAKMMSFAHDKVEAIKNLKNSSNTDKHSQSVLLELYDKRIEEIIQEQKNRVRQELGDDSFGNVSIDDIEGIDELGISYEMDE